jgi:hypothetical protein
MRFVGFLSMAEKWSRELVQIVQMDVTQKDKGTVFIMFARNRGAETLRV